MKYVLNFTDNRPETHSGLFLANETMVLQLAEQLAKNIAGVLDINLTSLGTEKYIELLTVIAKTITQREIEIS